MQNRGDIMLEKGELLLLKNGIWELDCPMMSLYKQGTDIIEHTGGGYIKRNKDGDILFKIYSNRTMEPLIQSSGIAGQVIPDEQYYKLVANDSFGRKWEAHKIIPSFRGHFDKSWTIVTGGLRSIKSTIELKERSSAKYCYLRLIFFDDIIIPFNTSSETIINIDGRDRTRRIDFNIAKYLSCGYEYEIASDDGIIELMARSATTELPRHFDIRIIEALQYIFARAPSCNVIEKKSGNTKTLEIIESNIPATAARIRPPLQTNPPSIDPKSRIWTMFDRYLNHILRYPEPKPHPLSNIVFEAIQGSSSSIGAQALAVAVAVEGALSVEYPNLACSSEGEKKNLRESIDLVKGSTIDENIKLRLLGAINSWINTGASAKSKLQSLVAMGVIENVEYKAWEKLRNSFAHASFPTNDLQILLDLSFVVTTLLNKVIFYAIGYIGEYTDYGVHGWPMKMFDCSMSCQSG